MQHRSPRAWLLISCLCAAAGTSSSQPPGAATHSAGAAAQSGGPAPHSGAAAPQAGVAAAPPDSPPSNAAAEFMAAMQRVRMNLDTPEAPDSAALKAYPIYDYLVAARLRGKLTWTPSEELDPAIDAFLRAHEGQPVARALRHQWLASLAERQRWDWFLPRSQDVTDPALICDRLQGRMATGDTDKLAADAL
ncbi:MAG TPA: hypothetical protein VK715_04895, partial [Steroidobacteraceae bacterium]|nr:hypothetical protein [Steroidobacteraceae bacterium]